MSAENCPFEINTPKEEASETKKKGKYVTFDITLILNDANSPTITQEVKKLDSTNPKQVLVFFQQFDRAVDALGLTAGAPRFRLIKSSACRRP